MSERRRDLQVIWSHAADRDLGMAYDYLRPLNPAAARKLVERVVKAVGALSRQPRLGRASEVEADRGYRELVVRPFRIFYRLESDRVVIVRVWDNRRDPDTLRMDDIES